MAGITKIVATMIKGVMGLCFLIIGAENIKMYKVATCFQRRGTISRSKSLTMIAQRSGTRHLKKRFLTSSE
jgi:hypothetical protein